MGLFYPLGTSYQTPHSLTVFRKILSEKTLKSLTVKFVGTGISSFKTVFSCYLYLIQYVLLIHLHLSHFHIFPLQEAVLLLLPDSWFRTSALKTEKKLTALKCIFIQCAMMWLTRQSSRRKRPVFSKRFGIQVIQYLMSNIKWAITVS